MPQAADVSPLKRATPAVRARRSRRLALALLVAGVALLHGWLLDRHAPSRLGDGAGDSRPSRLSVAFVRELAPQQPPAAPPAPGPQARLPAQAPAPASAASAASAAAPALVPSIEPMPEVAVAPVPALPEVPAQTSVEPGGRQAPDSTTAPDPAVGHAGDASAPPAFEWPPSTRLSYTLTGDFRGPVQGQAQVEWLRSGTRYQVHLDISVGPSFAPLLSRSITSEGEVTADGLRPSRYDEETRVVLREPRRLTIWLDADRVRLPGGAVLPRPAGVQDSASQFVQMTWLFTMQPQRLQAGQVIELPLALPRRVEPWIYDVLASETLDTPAGPVETVHVKPRRPGRPGQELTAEFWVAPSLQYLPVRILIRQDDRSYVDLLIERLPQQAERGR